MHIMRTMRSWLGNLIMRYLIMLFWDGWHIYFMYLFIYILCIAHPFCVCGDDRITRYPRADDLTSGPGDA